MIPRVFSCIWVQGDPPDHYRSWFESWERVNPGWTHKVWTEADYIDLLDHDTRLTYDSSPYSGSVKFSEQANIAGKTILQKIGGVVMCADFEALRPMEEILDTDDLVLWWESDNQMSSGILAAPPFNPAVTYLVERIPEAVRAQRAMSKDITNGAGPKGVHAIWRDSGLNPRPAREVYPYMWFDTRPESYGDAYAVHHWQATWKK